MKKSSFVALCMGTVSTVLFALGMCMALLPEWNALKQGVIIGLIGILLGIITVYIWRKMENKPKISIRPKTVLLIIYIALATLVFGAGMCLCLVQADFIKGTVIGLVGMVMFLGLIPMTKGLK
ncbi:MAG: hypothetical protein IJN59_01195 [Oscillospiraceae bacterium]|nr:hypothetical protein [Oscillospiraceae bacterium]